MCVERLCNAARRYPAGGGHYEAWKTFEKWMCWGGSEAEPLWNEPLQRMPSYRNGYRVQKTSRTAGSFFTSSNTLLSASSASGSNRMM